MASLLLWLIFGGDGLFLRRPMTEEDIQASRRGDAEDKSGVIGKTSTAATTTTTTKKENHQGAGDRDRESETAKAMLDVIAWCVSSF